MNYQYLLLHQIQLQQQKEVQSISLSPAQEISKLLGV